ncbi:MAG TPA: RNA polymerase sigma factor [Thermoanaerobaculia bacterium]|jgi:RNA polymerase sigma-70 factor (ECF subfamily)
MITGASGGSRDEEFEAMYRQYYARVFRFFRASGVADGEAQELAQETFIKIYKSFEQYRGEGPASYVHTTARRVLLNRMRDISAAKRRVEIVDIDDPEAGIDPPAAPEPDLADRQETELRRRRLVQAVSELPNGQKETLRLRMTGLKYHQIAAALGVSVDAVKSRLRDATKYLRERLGEKS